MHVITGDRRYLAFAWRVAKYALTAALIFFALMIAERLLAPAIPFV